MVCHRVNVGINILNIKDRLWMSVRDKILEIFAGLKWEFGGGNGVLLKLYKAHIGTIKILTIYIIQSFKVSDYGDWAAFLEVYL